MVEQPDFMIVKASGREEPYDRGKILSALKRTGVPEKLHDHALEYLEERLYDQIKTSEIFSNLKKFLKEHHRESAGRFGLKQALYRLGPTGYPFERYIGRLFEKLGYHVRMDQVVEGKCVTHEVDVIARQYRRHYMIECKFHHNQGIKSDIKVALYVWARFQDLEDGWNQDPAHHQELHEAWLVTNTRCTTDAHDFAFCRGMRIISWDQPAGEGLRELIGQTQLYPVTILSVFSDEQHRYLLDQGIVDVQAFLDGADKKMLDRFPQQLINHAEEEARLLL